MKTIEKSQAQLFSSIPYVSQRLIRNAGEVSVVNDGRDPRWLTYLGTSFMSTTNAGIGGPNIPPDSNGLIVLCVANSPRSHAGFVLGSGNRVQRLS